jgi:hypothetical protein
MKRRLLWVIALSVVVLSAIAVHHVLSARSKKRRAANYQSALLMYSQNLAQGLTRKDVENYLRMNRTGFVQRCCGEEKGSFSDLVKVGEEPAPWYCSSWPVFVALVFSRTEALQLPADSDVLKKIELVSNGEGCL